jgi:hypothetical protein
MTWNEYCAEVMRLRLDHLLRNGKPADLNTEQETIDAAMLWMALFPEDVN